MIKYQGFGTRNKTILNCTAAKIQQQQWPKTLATRKASISQTEEIQRINVFLYLFLCSYSIAGLDFLLAFCTNQMSKNPQFELLPHPPTTDLISAVKFTPRPSLPLLLTSTWDGDVSLYNTDTLTQLTTIRNDDSAAVLDIEWDEHGRNCFLGDINGDVKLIDLENCKSSPMGKGINQQQQHSMGVKCLKWFQGRLCSGSWDQTVRFWDVNQSNNSSDPMRDVIRLKEKVISMDSYDTKLVIACTGSTNYIYDIRNLQAPLEQHIAPSTRQRRRIKCLPTGEGYIQSTIDSRCYVEFFESPQEQNYAFRCHRHSTDQYDISYPVNALAFHRIHNTLFTGGSDGLVYLWSWKQRKRIKQYADFKGNSVLCMDTKENLLCIATGDDSYRFRGSLEGYDPTKAVIGPSRIYVRKMEDNEGKPSSQASVKRK